MITHLNTAGLDRPGRTPGPEESLCSAAIMHEKMVARFFRSFGGSDLAKNLKSLQVHRNYSVLEYYRGLTLDSIRHTLLRTHTHLHTTSVLPAQ